MIVAAVGAGGKTARVFGRCSARRRAGLLASSSLAGLAAAGLLAAAVLSMSGGASRAADLFWDGDDSTADADGGDGTWNTVNTNENWDDAATAGADTDWVNGSVAVFGGTAGEVTVSGSPDITGMTFTTTGYVIGGAGTIELDADSIIDVGAGLTAEISATIDNNASGITKNGTGTLILSGNNDYGGVTRVNAGTLDISGSIDSDDVLITGGQLLVGGDSLNNDADVDLTGGDFELTDDETIGSLSGTGGTVTLGANTLTVSGDGDTTEFAGVISGTGGLTKSGSDSLTLSGNNDYTGPTSVTDGTLIISGTITSDVTNDATFELDGGTVDGDVVNNDEMTSDGTSEVTGTLENAVGGELDVDTGTLTVGGELTNDGEVTVDLAATLIATAGINNNDQFTNNGTVNGNVLTNTGTIDNNVGDTWNGNVVSNDTGDINNAGAWNGTVTNTGGTFDNLAGGTVSGLLTNEDGTTTNDGTLNGGALVSGGELDNNAQIFGLASVSGGELVNDGTLNDGASVSGGLLTNNNSILDGATVSGGELLNDGTISGGAIVSGGLLTNNDTIDDSASVSGGELLNDGTINGGATVTGGTLTTIDTINDGLTNVSGTVNAEGNINGPIDNQAAGIFNLTGNLAGDGVSTFLNAGTFNSEGTLAVSNIVGFTNSGIVSMQNGVVGDQLTLAGTFTGNPGSTINLDVDLSDLTPTADTLVLNTTAGSTVVNFSGLTGALAPDLLVIDTADGNLVANEGTGLADVGLVLYSLVEVGNDWFVRSQLNLAPIGGIVGGISSAQALINTTVNRPTSPFVSSPVDVEANTCAPGGYGRLFGGTAEAETTTTSPVSTPAVSEIKLDYAGAQIGVDFGCFNVGGGGAAVNVGLLGGVNVGKSTQDQPVPPTGARLISDNEFDSRYVGIYATYLKGNFFGDMQVVYDRTDFEIDSFGIVSGNAVPFVEGQTPGSERVTVSGSTGYAFNANDFTLVPSVGFAWSRTQTDTIGLSQANGRLIFHDLDSLIGFASLAVAQTIILSNETSAIQPFVTGTIYNDFGDDQEVTFTDDANPGVLTTTDNLGTFGEISVGFNYRSIYETDDGGLRELAASLRGDLTVSDRILGGRLVGQMRLQW